MSGFSGAVEGGVLHGYDVVNNLTTNDSNKPGSAAMLKYIADSFTRDNVSSRLSSNYGTISGAYEMLFMKFCSVSIQLNVTTAIPKNVTFLSGLAASVLNRAPIVSMYNNDDGKMYSANMSSSGELTSHVEALPTGNYRMSVTYVTN